MKKAYIRTFGCQMNVHDSEKIAGVLIGKGYSITDDKKEADLIVFNTCSIRQKAEQKFRSELGRVGIIKKYKPDVKVAVAGCIARQKGGEILKRASYVDYILGPQNIGSLGEMVGAEGGVAIDDNPGLAMDELPAQRKDRYRAWVSIMYGCNNFCSYCIVPYTRGREVSRPGKSIISEINALAGEGCKEVTLLGQNVNSYKSDTDFSGLLQKINDIEGIERIRFVTSHPRDLSDDLIKCMATLEKLCGHIHLPLQSGANRVLAAMKRGYTYEEYKGKIDKLRDAVPDIAITSDFIAGFPGETEQDHMDTLNALREIRYDGIFAFKFSPRPGTAASTMEGQVDEEMGIRRLQEILRLQDEITLEVNKRLEGRVEDVFVEGPSELGNGQLTGRTRSNKIVNFKADADIVGRIVKVKISSSHRHSLEGEIIPYAL